MPAASPPAAADCLTDLLRLEDDAAEIALTPNLPKIRMRFNPAKSLLAALAARMIKGIERVTPILYFSLRGVEVKVDGVRPDMPPKMERSRMKSSRTRIESDHQMDLPRENVKILAQSFNTVAPGTSVNGVLRQRGVTA